MRFIIILFVTGLCTLNVVGQRSFLRPFSDIPSERHRIQVSVPVDLSLADDFYGFAPMLEVQALRGIYVGVQAGPAFVPGPFSALAEGKQVWGRELGGRVTGVLTSGYYSSQFNIYLLLTNYRGEATVDGYSDVTSGGVAARRGSYDVEVHRTRTAIGLGWSYFTPYGFYLQLTAGVGGRATRVEAPVQLYPGYNVALDNPAFGGYVREGETKRTLAFDGAFRLGYAF